MSIAEALRGISDRSGVGIVFKASFDKANRSSIDSFRGPGVEEGLLILDKVRKETGMAVLTDIHTPEQARPAGEVCDCVQVPAFLCRQTDLLVAAGQTGKAVSVKKGQFVSPVEMKNVLGKVKSTGNDKVMFTERGTFFGYNRLVNDMTGISIMRGFGVPVVFDATHSTQQPGGLGDSSAGIREMGPVLAKSAVAAGADGLFLEVHNDCENARCDKECIMPIEWVEDLILRCRDIYDIIRK